MKRKYKGILKIRPCYSWWIKHLMNIITRITKPDKFKMKKLMVRNDISFFHIENGPGVYLRIEEVSYEKKI